LGGGRRVGRVEDRCRTARVLLSKDERAKIVEIAQGAKRREGSLAERGVRGRDSRGNIQTSRYRVTPASRYLGSRMRGKRIGSRELILQKESCFLGSSNE